ncbi:M73 family metallopeptidase [Saccharothrix obliqua]|uniref:M73 family metallopeptidase n=1 Tax=Saccharothrix obliqua TaxID=2861747 RepID=UPI001C5E8950|nr:M73 family metallopeptidase [Saccharothrix obliqua]MBW4718119.1 M73 family metallopeptidase [Saccharothrix obliqua]
MGRLPRSKSIVRHGAAPLGLVLSGALVLGASHAAFTAQTSTGENSWSTGTITLTNDQDGAAAFQVRNMKPGETGTKDIKVTYSGEGYTPAIRLFAKGGSGVGDSALAKQIQLTIKRGKPGSGDSFVQDADSSATWTGSLDTFGGITSHDGGVLGYDGANGASTIFRIEYGFSPTGDANGLMGKSAQTTFTWQAKVG